ncbi:hypothetical protein C1646_761084 [Rhizophagus diaphanus]|nr:hypothetical protein C1646_761084 [Rhizophagus diaphanus] [Rhizophagus sp. MUCL 43196]
MQLKGNTFIVTGGGNGLGLSAAQELLRANVVEEITKVISLCMAYTPMDFIPVE